MSAALALSACGSDDGGGGEEGEGKIGVILPDTKSSVRWESADRPALTKAFKDAGVEYDIQNAEGDAQRQATIAEQMITEGATVLAIVNLDSASGAQIQESAEAEGVQTIDYDRLTLGGSAEYYVSFDNTVVGELQGQGLADALKEKPQGANVIEIEGAPTDNNATLFYNGQQKVLKPKYEAGDLKLVQSKPIDKWDNQVGGTTFEQILTGNGGKVDGVVAATVGPGRDERHSPLGKAYLIVRP